MFPKRNCFKVLKYAVVVVMFFLGVALLIGAGGNFSNVIKHGPSSNSHQLESFTNETFSNTSLKSNQDRVEKMYIDVLANTLQSPDAATPNYRVHTFYYPWYGNPQFDGSYLHWNHEYIPNWDKNDKNVYPEGRHQPPDDIGANYYPLLGCYSSRDESVINQHMKWIRDAGIGVLVISWYPPEEADKEGKPFDQLFPLFLDTAAKYNLKISFHIEPYKGRNPVNLRENVKYIIDKYGNHPALYRYSRNSAVKSLPVFYVYDSYLNTAKSWSALLKQNGELSIRGTEYDAIFLGLIVELRHKQDILVGGFDGFFTYFAANDFTYGSSWKSWKSLGSFSRKKGLLFVPSVGPGYIDTRVRPWNDKTTRERNSGIYYRMAWKSAIQSLPSIISITSFNEWHEGTQIEPATVKELESYVYEDYSPNTADFYINLTRRLIDEFALNNLAA